MPEARIAFRMLDFQMWKHESKIFLCESPICINLRNVLEKVFARWCFKVVLNFRLSQSLMYFGHKRAALLPGEALSRSSILRNDIFGCNWNHIHNNWKHQFPELYLSINSTLLAATFPLNYSMCRPEHTKCVINEWNIHFHICRIYVTIKKFT